MSDEAPPAEADRPVRFVLESDLGLLVNVTADGGDHLLIWTSREDAERMVPAFVGAGTYQVVAIDTSELRDELTGMRDDGMRFVLLDPQPDADGHMLAIDDAIAVYDRLAGPPPETDAVEDHFIQRLERARRNGADLDPDAEQIPLDCPTCRSYFTLPEKEYRAWRGGRTEVLRCPKCRALFREAEFDRVRCSDCGMESGLMPVSLSRGMRSSEHPWRCLDCGEAEIKRLAAAKTKKPTFLDDVNWYSLIVGGAALIALIAGLFVKFVLMAE